MAVRVKKLAKELGVAAESLFGWLREIGYDRYRDEMDMLPDPVVSKLRKHAASRRRELGAHPGRAVSAPPAPQARRSNEDWDIPVRGSLDLDQPIAQAVSLVDTLAPLKRTLHEAADAVKAERAALEERARRLAERAVDLEREADRLREERDRLELERETLIGELDQARQEIESRARDLDAIAAGGVPLHRLLEARGLRGADEQGRALAALSRSRLLDPLVSRLRVVDAGPVENLLRDRLALAEEAMEMEGVAWVVVPPDRAEVPSAAQLTALRDRLWSELLLCGLRRVRVLGAGSIALRCLRTVVDPRINVSFVPVIQRDATGALEDVAEADALIVQGVAISTGAQDVYDHSSIRVFRSDERGVVSFFQEILSSLEAL
jgi:hypothetical protein